MVVAVATDYTVYITYGWYWEIRVMTSMRSLPELKCEVSCERLFRIEQPPT